MGFQPGESIALSGELVHQGRQLSFDNPDYERGDRPAVHTRGLVPVHPLTAGLTEREMRFRVHWAVTHFAQSVPEPLPEAMRAEYHLLPIDAALRQMHFPASTEQAAEARRGGSPSKSC